jgi:hypothetical protein
MSYAVRGINPGRPDRRPVPPAVVDDVRASGRPRPLHAEARMHLGEDWGAHLREAGFTVQARRRFDITVQTPLPAAAGRYAQARRPRGPYHAHGLGGAASRAAGRPPVSTPRSSRRFVDA